VEETTALDQKSGEGQRLRRTRSEQKVPWDGGGGDDALGLGREDAMGARDEGERLMKFEPGQRKNGESRGRARHALWKEVRDAAVVGAMAVYDQWSRGGVAGGPLWPLVRAAPEKNSNIYVYSKYSNGFKLIQSKYRVPLLEKFQIKY
jgi:hypothetical protein